MNPYGEYGRPLRIMEAYKEWRDERLLEEADSKADFPSFLFGPIRTSLWHGYSRAQAQYRRYSRVENATDFRERRLKGLNGLVGIGHVGDHGDYPELKRSERPAASLVVDTYGGVYEITRQAIRNDDSNELLNRNPADMGYAAGVFILEAIVALIESNPTAPDNTAMYHTDHGNLVTTALSEDSIATAISTMEDQLDDDGRHIVVTPRVLTVKTARMQLTANRILNSQETGTNITYGTKDDGTFPAAGAGTGTFDKGTINPLQGILPADGVVRDPYFSDANDWRLFADPNDVPAFAVGFLDGKEEPFVGLKDPMVRSALGAGVDPYDFDFDSIDFKTRFDFGVAPVDPRGTYWAQVT